MYTHNTHERPQACMHARTREFLCAYLPSGRTLVCKYEMPQLGVIYVVHCYVHSAYMASTLLQRVAVTARVLTVASWRMASVRCLPVCSVDTNLKRSAVPTTFNKELSLLIATVLKKPPEVNVGKCKQS